jgi:organic radical activating enzyme
MGKYKSCYWINSGLHFLKDGVRFCCYEYLHTNSENIIFPNYKGEKLDYTKYFEIKNTYKNMAKSGNVHPNCQNCIYLTEEEWSDDDYFDHFIFNHWQKCNSNCIYCIQTLLPKSEKKLYYNVLPVIKDMKKNSLLKSTPQNCVVFGGGEPTLLSEFDKLIDFFLKENFNNIRVNSSGIKYSKSLANAIKNNSASLVISPDSGSKSMYELIKRVKTFDVVWNNIKKYVKDTNQSNNVIIKYIIIPKINDNKTEIDNFFNLILNSKVKKVSVSLEDHWYHKFYPNFPQHIYDILDYFMAKTKYYDLDCEMYCEAKSVLEQRKNG